MGARAFYGVWDLDCPAYIGSGNTCIQKGLDKQFGYYVEGSYRWELDAEYGQTIGLFIRRGNRDTKLQVTKLVQILQAKQLKLIGA